MRPRLNRSLVGSIAAIAFTLFLAACTLGGHTPTPTPQRHTLEDFNFLTLGMTYDEVRAVVGPADQDVGSGLTIYMYELADGTRILLNFGGNDSLARVFRGFPDGTRELILGTAP
jgi:hypothetical protein